MPHERMLTILLNDRLLPELAIRTASHSERGMVDVVVERFPVLPAARDGER
jgi:hypothetical protein